MKLILITGASRGLGKELLSVLLKNTANQIICLSKNRLTSDVLEYYSEKLTYTQVDLSSIDSLLESLCKLDLTGVEEVLFINNAGIVSPIESVDNLEFSEIMLNVNINLVAPMTILAHLLSKGVTVDIANISSGAANQPLQNWSLYCGSKAGIKMFFDVYKLENTGVKVIHWDPGVIDTDMQREIRESNDFPLRDKFMEFKKMGKLKDPKDAARDIYIELKEQKIL